MIDRSRGTSGWRGSRGGVGEESPIRGSCPPICSQHWPIVPLERYTALQMIIGNTLPSYEPHGTQLRFDSSIRSRHVLSCSFLARIGAFASNSKRTMLSLNNVCFGEGRPIPRLLVEEKDMQRSVPDHVDRVDPGTRLEEFLHDKGAWKPSTD